MKSKNDPAIAPEELQRLKKLTFFERKARRQGFSHVAGVDEAGRGPLAGPVVAAACIIPSGLLISQVNDSKQVPPHIRAELFKRLTEDHRISYGVGIVDSLEIDRINIYQATIQAMLKAIEALPHQPHCLLVDGLKLPHPTLHVESIVGGDALSLSIGAASIIAKEIRDRIMVGFHEEWPHYGFNQHKGYGTAMHMECIDRHGPCPIHRRSFEPIKTRFANKN
jgi:ribonuclease HII